MMNEEEMIIQGLLAKGNKEVVDWIQKLNAEELYQLLAQNITYQIIIELVERFKKDFDTPKEYF